MGGTISNGSKEGYQSIAMHVSSPLSDSRNKHQVELRKSYRRGGGGILGFIGFQDITRTTHRINYLGS